MALVALRRSSSCCGSDAKRSSRPRRASSSAAAATCSPMGREMARWASRRMSLTRTSKRSACRSSSSLSSDAPLAAAPPSLPPTPPAAATISLAAAVPSSPAAVGGGGGAPAGRCGAHSPSGSCVEVAESTLVGGRAAAAGGAQFSLVSLVEEGGEAAVTAAACVQSSWRSSGSAAAAIISRLRSLFAERLPRMKHARMRRGRSAWCSWSTRSKPSTARGSASMRRRTSSWSDSLASTRQTFIASSACCGVRASNPQSSSTQPVDTNCFRLDPLTARLRSVALTCTSKWTGRTAAPSPPPPTAAADEPRGVVGTAAATLGPSAAICARSTDANVPTAPSCRSTRWLAASADTFLSAPAA
mmetsp:Transcript_50305/g.132884  ORF Transcript_50305/g.132884 Transcript_50305/m.132884 type:complete len:359 (+) Transcript_50305:757-1833(+)